MLHKEILSSSQQSLLPLIKNIGSAFVLCGGTAIALYIGHRASIDFDLFTSEDLNLVALRKKLAEVDQHFAVLVKNNDEYTVVVQGVKITFLHYPFPFTSAIQLDDTVLVPDLLTLSAMKAYALGRRSKWKDYVDLYYIFSQRYSISTIVAKATNMFGKEFNEKIFRAALAYFEDVDYSESVSFADGFQVDNATIQKKLREVSVGG